MLNKTTRPIGLVDASSTGMESYRQGWNILASGGTGPPSEEYTMHMMKTRELAKWIESLDASKAVRCYRRQLLTSLSSRLQLPLLVLTEMRECPGATIESEIDWFTLTDRKGTAEYPYHRLMSPYAPTMVHSIAPSSDLLSELLKHLTILNEEAWKGFAIVYEKPDDFLKYRSSLENLQTDVLIRCWEKSSFFKAQIIREIKHLNAFFLDLSNSNIEQFFQMMGNQALDVQYAKYFIFNHKAPLVGIQIPWVNFKPFSSRYILDISVERTSDYLLFSPHAHQGPLQPLLSILRNVRGKLVVIRFKIPSTARSASKRSLQGQLIQNVVHYYAEALRLSGPQLQVPEHITCNAVHASLLRTADGLLEVLRSNVGYMDIEGPRTMLDYGVELMNVSGETIQKYADWNMKSGFVYTETEEQSSVKLKSQLENETFIVTTIEDPPFVIYEPIRQGKQLHGNDQWTGFAMELLKHLSVMNHFDYVIKPVEDRKFGTFDENKGRWNGLIGELIYKVE
ncbi:uncharacterized protein DEA37_0002623 [Paragonimus westermani]|uniref:Ionotropic glutamate receptor L-glutamate and glycine-binding domain-containing protein n=1 Tax=Paragonimus westermani TaxID=34504 RepID=A0A5J4NZ46_9TREM|nr:uncharacterized protein DEA37_0002623 [Paragonimus westermani]